MNDTTVRIHVLGSDGIARDAELEFGLKAFAGHLPAVGDEVLVPGVSAGYDRSDPRHRRFWRVRRRIFNPRDLRDFVVLVVEEGTGTAEDGPIIG